MKLGVNIDHVATLRQVRCEGEPELVLAALLCESAGADSIVVHLREDRRHIQDEDLYILKKVVKTGLNLEMSVSPDIVAIACDVKPDQATLVPERRREVTTEGGLDVGLNFKRVKETVDKLNKCGIAVSLFIDPDKNQIKLAKKTGAAMLEFHTGRYAQAKKALQRNARLRELTAAVRLAKAEGFRVFAGHGLNYSNVSEIAGIKGIEELNIGYSIVCRAVIVGLGDAVKQMKELMNRPIIR